MSVVPPLAVILAVNVLMGTPSPASRGQRALVAGEVVMVGGLGPGTSRPDAGAVVVVSSSRGGHTTVTTGSSGQFRLAVPPGHYDIALQPGSGSCRSAHVTLSSRSVQQLVLRCDIR